MQEEAYHDLIDPDKQASLLSAQDICLCHMYCTTNLLSLNFFPGLLDAEFRLCAAAQVTDISSNAKFILLVEKDAAFMRLSEDRFYNTFPCIIITAKGQPDVASRYPLLFSLLYYWIVAVQIL